MKSMPIKWTTLPLITGVLLQSCSEPQDAPTSPENTVSVHGEGWLNPASSNFHGNVLADQNYDATDCRPCHGNQYDGGVVDVSCYKCHASYPHPTSGWVSGPNSHPVFLKENNYDLASCQPCHGEDYGLVKVNNSCLTCHTQQGGPEACNTCHGNPGGNAAELINAAPPLGLDDETDPATPAVGAHQAHFAYFSHLPTSEVCQECHVVPGDFFDPAHIDDNNRVEPVFNGPLGNLITQSGERVPQPGYDPNANTCSNNYCHGNWGLLKSDAMENSDWYAAELMTGTNGSPKWTQSGAPDCESCHGLPPTGHIAAARTACAICHIGVVDDFGEKIIDKTKHVNGMINVFGEEKPMH